MKFSKKSLYTIALALGIIMIILILLNAKMRDDIRINLLTEFIGVFFTIIVIEGINEFRKNKDFEFKEHQKIKRITEILMPLFQLYYDYLVRMIQPIGSQDYTKIHSFKFTDFQYFYNISLYQINSSYEKSFIPHFNTLLKLREEVSKLMIHIDDQSNPEFLALMKVFIINNAEVDILFENFKNKLRMQTGNEPTIDFDTDFFKKIESGEIDQDVEFIEVRSHALFAYARFYRITKKNIEIIEKICRYANK